MYPVTNEFKLAAKQPVQEHRLYGTIGSVSFDESNIIQGSFHITNQCTDTNDVVLGSVYTGTLTATFTGLSISRYAWIGKRITVYFGLKTTPTTWEDIPMGIFTVKEAKHSADGVSITAYDDMIKLDKKFKKSKFVEPAKIFNYLRIICNTCGLILEDSEETIQSRPNGNTLLGIVGTKSNSKLKKYANDIETYRDLVFWIAQSMACFATINKLGHLTFVPYKNESNVVDEITEAHRIAGAVFDDFTTNYTGIYVTNTADGEEIYYGYDEQELEQEIATVEGDIQDVEIALDQLAQQYQQGQITEAEYKRQKKVLDKQLKNLDKRLAWLNEALNKAQSEEDGLYMDLGENPMMQADGVGNTPTTMRKRILKALDAISYTPFTCDTVCGAHYDLGDIIRFTGGHATELGEVCCVMAYDFNMNGEYRMQGFGSDPSKGVMKSKNSKKADKANRNADSSAKNTTGYSSPDSGNDGDLFVKVNANVDAESIYAGTGMTIDSQSGDNNSGYTVVAHCTDDAKSESIHFKYENLVVGRTYTLSCSIKIDEMKGDWGSHDFCICVRSQDSLSGATIPFAPGGTVTPLSDGVAVTLYYDTNEHSYQVSFSAPATTCYVIIDISYLHNTWYGTTCPTHVNNFKISEGSEVSNGNPDGIKVYVNDEWKNLDYVKKVVQYQPGIIGGGTKIFEAKNSDGSTTDIFSPIVKVDDVKMNNTSVVVDKVAKIVNMTGATSSDAGTAGLVPAPAAGDNQKFLCGDGTFKTVSGGSSITPNPSGTATANLEKVTIESTIYAIKDTNAVHSADKGVANGVASLDANAKIPSAQIPSLSSDYLPLAGGEMTGRIDTYAPPSDIMPAIMPKTAFCGSVGFSNKPYRFGFFQGAVLGASYEEAGTSKMGTLSMYTGLGAYAAVIKPDSSQSASEVDLVLPKTSGTLALTSEIPTKTSDLTNDSGFVTTETDPTVPSWAKAANKPSYTFNEIGAGYAKIGDGTNYITLRTDTGWHSGMYYHTSGDEAFVFGVENTRTSFIFCNTAPDNRTTWTNLSPALQIKNNKVAINKLIANSAYLTYALEVNGDVQATNFRGDLIGTAEKASKNASGVAFGDLATINKGSGSSKFLREDGTWQTVTATDSTKLPLTGGTMTGTITTADGNIPAIKPTNDGNGSIGSSSNRYNLGYINYIHTKNVYIKGDGNYVATLGYESLAVRDATFYLPKNNGGTLVTDSYLNSKLATIDQTMTTSNGQANYYRNGKVVYVTLVGFTYLANYTVPSGYMPKDYYTYAVVFDVSGKRYVHIQIKTDGLIVVRNSNDTILTSYKLYGTICYLIP